MIGKRCLSFSYLSENYSQNLRIFVSSNRDSKMFAISYIHYPKTVLKIKPAIAVYLLTMNKHFRIIEHS